MEQGSDVHTYLIVSTSDLSHDKLLSTLIKANVA